MGSDRGRRARSTQHAALSTQRSGGEPGCVNGEQMNGPATLLGLSGTSSSSLDERIGQHKPFEASRWNSHITRATASEPRHLPLWMLAGAGGK